MPPDAWKILNRLKDGISKLSLDKMVHTDLQIFNRNTQQPFDLYELVKFGENKIASVQQAVQQIYKSNIVEAKTDDIQKSGADMKQWKMITQISQVEDISKAINILNSLELSLADQHILTSVESLITLLKQHPEIRHRSVQHGAIRILLNKRSIVTNELTRGAIREALAILGYADPVPGQGIRILSIDGGGIRGILVLEMLKKLEELTGKPTHELFDFICGVSTGSILTYSIGVHFRSVDSIIKRYEELSQEIFNQSALWGTGSLVWSHAYYDTKLWEQKLKEYLGTDNLISTSRNPKSPKLCVVSTLVNESEVAAYMFRNYDISFRLHSQYAGTYNAELWQAARASAAAPTFFEEFRIRDLILQDGGILVNNPSAIAIHEAKLIWPNTPIQCVVSFGTGRIVSNRNEFVRKHNENKFTGTSWTDQLNKIVDSATDTRAVHVILGDLLPDDVYYRFNPYLTEMIGIVETDKDKHEQLKKDVLMYMRRNEDKFHEAANTLLLKKTLSQRVQDKLQFQRDIWGL